MEKKTYNQSPTSTIETYEEFAKDFIAGKGFRTVGYYIANKALSDWTLLNRIDLNGKRVLNIGCCEPIDELTFASRAESWTAVDLSPESINAARYIVQHELSPEVVKKIRFQVEDARKLSFPDEAFDVVLSFSTVEHLENKEDRHALFKEAARVVKKGGYIIITTTNKWCLPYIIFSKWVQSKNYNGKRYFNFEYFYSPLELRNEVKSVGLQPEFFTSNMQILVPGIPYLFLDRVLYKILRLFGSRMGYLARKP